MRRGGQDCSRSAVTQAVDQDFVMSDNLLSSCVPLFPFHCPRKKKVIRRRSYCSKAVVVMATAFTALCSSSGPLDSEDLSPFF